MWLFRGRREKKTVRSTQKMYASIWKNSSLVYTTTHRSINRPLKTIAVVSCAPSNFCAYHVHQQPTPNTKNPSLLSLYSTMFTIGFHNQSPYTSHLVLS